MPLIRYNGLASTNPPAMAKGALPPGRQNCAVTAPSQGGIDRDLTETGSRRQCSGWVPFGQNDGLAGCWRLAPPIPVGLLAVGVRGCRSPAAGDCPCGSGAWPAPSGQILQARKNTPLLVPATHIGGGILIWGLWAMLVLLKMYVLCNVVTKNNGAEALTFSYVRCLHRNLGSASRTLQPYGGHAVNPPGGSLRPSTGAQNVHYRCRAGAAQYHSSRFRSIPRELSDQLLQLLPSDSH